MPAMYPSTHSDTWWGHGNHGMKIPDKPIFPTVSPESKQGKVGGVALLLSSLSASLPAMRFHCPHGAFRGGVASRPHIPPAFAATRRCLTLPVGCGYDSSTRTNGRACECKCDGKECEHNAD